MSTFRDRQKPHNQQTEPPADLNALFHTILVVIACSIILFALLSVPSCIREMDNGTAEMRRLRQERVDRCLHRGGYVLNRYKDSSLCISQDGRILGKVE